MTGITIAQDNRLTTARYELLDRKKRGILSLKRFVRSILLELFSVIYLMIQFEN
jgi:hypothetical protein